MPPNFNYSEIFVRDSPNAKIVGGSPANTGEFPYHILLKYNDNYLCGGSILNTLLILTAAHCFKYKQKSQLRVFAGVYDLRNTSSPSIQIRSVRNIYFHGNYCSTTQANDIAILVLDKDLEYTSYVKNIRLPQANEAFAGLATATGWGLTSENGSSSNVLKKVELPLVALDECRLKYGRNVITDGMICAGNEGRDTCQGDSGGPMTCTQSDGTVVQCGVTSFGIGCGRPKFPGVYARVSKYISWINQINSKSKLPKKCSTQYFYCTHGNRCISRSYICNGNNNCGPNGTNKTADEIGCTSMEPCPANHFRCNNGLCIKNNWVCDGDFDCSDRSDEEKCPTKTKTCSPTERQCGASGRCIPEIWWCDGIKDCDNNSDEVNCVATVTTTEAKRVCATDEFYCLQDSMCIPKRWMCDGNADCASGDDEEYCDRLPGKCSKDYFYCANGNRCIPRSYVCDGNNNCGTNGTNKSEDETGCTSMEPCPPNHFRCNNGLCIQNNWVCDGDVDCYDRSDEAKCPNIKKTCSSSEHQCGAHGRCIPKTWKCDRIKDCENNSDETNCVRTTTKRFCTTHEFYCPIDSKCIPVEYKCNNVNDCAYGEDEKNCESDDQWQIY